MKKILIIMRNRFNQFFLDNESYARKLGVKIGSDCFIGTRNFGSEPYLISIGDHVQVTSGVRFFTHGGGWVFRDEVPDFDCFGKIVIKNNVYIGHGTIILPGTTIESNVIVGARSVITKSVPSGVVVAGNPAKIVGSIDEQKKKLLPYILKTRGMSQKQKCKLLLNTSSDTFIKKAYLKQK